MDKRLHNLFSFYIELIGDNMLLSDLQNKDIINMRDGKKIGSIIDAKFNIASGNIEKLIVEPSKSLFSIKNASLEIGFNQIKKIGEDVILVEYIIK